MTVSLIIPVYNEQDYLPGLLDSLLRQTRLPDEIIICNNASTDDSLKVINRYLTRLPLKVITEKRKGIHYTVETAWKAASGDLILRTDADCVLPPTWVARMVSHLENDPQLMAGGGFFLSSDGSLLIKLLTFLILPFLAVYQSRLIYGANMIIRRTALIAVNGYQFQDRRFPDDQLLSQKLRRQHLKFSRFFDCTIYTSTRRFHGFSSIFHGILAVFKPDFYIEKI